jgi:hypothetical protein
MMRARVVRTAAVSNDSQRAAHAHTLGNVDVTPRETVEGGQAGIHVDAMLQLGMSRLSHRKSLHAYRIQHLP